MTWLGGAVLVAAALLLARPIQAFLADPGYGSFDMTTASAFDRRWLRGSATFGVGLWLLTGSPAVAWAAAIAVTFSSMWVKPIVKGVLDRRVARLREAERRPE